MLGLPQFGQRVRVWPFPGRKVQNGPRPVDRWGGGSWLPNSGAIVVWSTFHHEQLLAGDLLLHAPPCDEHDFGEQLNGGKQEHDACQNCGRDMKAAQQYDADYAKGAGARETQSEAPAASNELYDPIAAQKRDLPPEPKAAPVVAPPPVIVPDAPKPQQ